MGLNTELDTYRPIPVLSAVSKVNTLCIDEKIKVKVYVNQGKSLSHIKIRHAYDFSLCFRHELLMSI